MSPGEGPKVIVLGRKVPLPTEPSFRPTHNMFWSKVSHRDLGLTVIRGEWLPNESQVSNFCFCRARSYKCTGALFWFLVFVFRWVLRTKLRSLYLPYKHIMSELSLSPILQTSS